MMVEQMGMSDVIGPRNIAQQQAAAFMMPSSNEGSDLKNKADAEVDRILAEQYERGMSLLTEHRSILDSIANTLIEKEKIDGIEMLDLIKSINPALVSEEAVKKVTELVAKTTEAVVDAAKDAADIASGDDGPTPATAQ